MPGSADYPWIPDPVPAESIPKFGFEQVQEGERIGSGGNANVYRASVTLNGTSYTVAVKEPRFGGTIQTEALERFRDEAETWERLDDHDNVVSVHAWGVDPLPWLVLEYMDGGTLDTKLGTVDLPEALWLAGRIAEGIRHGHRHGIAHLDVKPANVLLRNTDPETWEYPKVSDWGLAKMLLDHSTSIEGISPTYAAPEQFDAEEFGSPDDITDIYQFGAVTYALLTGRPPFTGSATAVMRKALHDEPDPPSAHNSDVPKPVDDIVMKTLTREKRDRYDGLLPVRNELDRVFDTLVDDDDVAEFDRDPPATGNTATTQSTSPGANRDRDRPTADPGPATDEPRQATSEGSAEERRDVTSNFAETDASPASGSSGTNPADAAPQPAD